MADFIAVIRRAVDGLSENTPEMRVKVYERARGAVQRQLENMKPRPPEAMLQRQLEKLEAAIREVEAEHAEAVPSADDVAAAAAPEVETAHEPEATAPEPVAAEPTVDEPADETSVHQEHVEAEEPAPAYQEPREEPAHYHEEPAAAEPEYAAQHDTHWPHEEPSAPAEEVEPVEHLRSAPSEEVAHEERQGSDEHVGIEEPVAEPTEPPYVEPALQPAARDYDLTNRLVEPVYGLDRSPEEFVDRSQEEPLHADAAGHFDPVWAEPVEETPAPPAKDAPTDWALEELRQFSEAAPVAPANEAARAFEDVIAGIDHAPASVKMPAANEGFSWEAAAFDDLPPIESGKKVPINAHFDDGDLFSEIHGTAKAAPETNPAWQEARPLRGYDNRGVVAEDDDGTAPPDLDSAVAAKFQGKNLRMEPKRRRFGIGSIVTILIALGVVGGGGYAAWTHQDALSTMLKNLVSAAPSQSAKNEQAPAKPDASTPAAAPQTSDAKPADANKEVASLNDGAAVNNKFNQRLRADGTEVDSGPAAVPGTPTAEGKSVAEQNVAAADPTPPATSTTPPSTSATPPAATSAATPPADGAAQTAPVGSNEKMFLYEERIGQSSPTAIQGSVVWSLQHEAGSDGRQEASVQATVTVPERNLSAQLTFKRNSDPSLPASHIVEVVFSLPPNFEGGAIESVQRISMKRTEQDRGDALIAVPAKITDDFHMIALNDYPDARKANLDLLGSRDWIDIPITYRNGRRALLTMQKGSTGAEAFNAAIKEWAAFGDVSTSQ
ncbi:MULTISPECIES: hypothetical protein [unclassified Rhizobium]|uniref:hypothetical protein n=1 Tax=unclassified Rhizobium TaxID=2613769 RepID=UPI0016173168|nr:MULTISPECIES: hypothetical protein [unclassified Rhizobium]MBB3541183.1 hypothetical protein [Rhizobium sp. BK399]MCS4092142.1 hypothetical protein [Rhizobium sp. BK176]